MAVNMLTEIKIGTKGLYDTLIFLSLYIDKIIN